MCQWALRSVPEWARRRAPLKGSTLERWLAQYGRTRFTIHERAPGRMTARVFVRRGGRGPGLRDFVGTESAQTRRQVYCVRSLAEYRFSSAISPAAAAGARTPVVTMARFSNRLP